MKKDNSPLSSVSPKKPVWKRGWFINLLFILAGAMGVYTLIYVDVITRSKEAYLEGEKYLSWHKDPSLKSQYFQNLYVGEKTKLDRQLEKKKISSEEYEEKLDILKFDQEFSLAESPLKYAYQWFKDAYELFSPPECKWVRLSREKAPQVLEMWKEELRSKKIPFEDYMFE
jgi:hypothetical protein